MPPDQLDPGPGPELKPAELEAGLGPAGFGPPELEAPTTTFLQASRRTTGLRCSRAGNSAAAVDVAVAGAVAVAGFLRPEEGTGRARNLTQAASGSSGTSVKLPSWQAAGQTTDGGERAFVFAVPTQTGDCGTTRTGDRDGVGAAAG